MLRNFIFIVLIGVLFSSCKNSSSSKVGFFCSYYGDSNFLLDEITDKNIELSFSSESAAQRVIEEILAQQGLDSDFKVLEHSDVENAAAVIYENERYIIYNKDFMASVKEITGSHWAPISILAHEIGHHLQGHTLNSNGNRHKMELAADKFSGFVLNQMGASLEDSQIAIKKLVSESGSATHPARRKRLNAILEGFTNSSKTNKNTHRNLKQIANKEISGKDQISSVKEYKEIFDRLLINRNENYLLNDVEFDPETALISNFNKFEIEALVSTLRKNPNSKILISVHTDNEISDEENQRISTLRAINIEFLLEALGVGDSQVKSKGVGNKNIVKARKGLIEINFE